MDDAVDADDAETDADDADDDASDTEVEACVDNQLKNIDVSNNWF